MRTLLHAIDFMHAKGIVHRDLKPENILLSDRSASATIKVVDFGLSQYTQTDTPSLLQTVCGTHKYLSPEMILCDRGRLRGYSKAVDMWGIGIILFVMLFGFNPFEGRTRAETHENILK
jgi:serine/threonine protein kinase